MKTTLAAVALLLTSFTVNASYTGAAEKIEQCEINAGTMELVLKAKKQGMPSSLVYDALTSNGEVLSSATENMIDGIYAGVFDRLTPEELGEIIYDKCIEASFK